MPPRRPEGSALLIAGFGAPGITHIDGQEVHVLGQIGEALLATGARWHVRRLTAALGERTLSDRRTIKRTLNELSADQEVRIAVMVLLARFIRVAGELTLVTGPDADEFPEDTTLPLSYIRERLAAARARQVITIVSGCGDGEPAEWLAALDITAAHHRPEATLHHAIVAIDAPAGPANPIVNSLLGALCGDALDPRRGAITMASLSSFLSTRAAAVRGSDAHEVIAEPPPFGGLYDLRRAAPTVFPPRKDAPEDLTGMVLPGRFRLDEVVARGTFGTVYRARQLAVDRDVAVKVLHGDIDPRSEDGRLFVHEVQAVGRMDHPNIVRILQADVTYDGRLFYAMELLEGTDLEAYGSAAGKLPIDDAVEVVCKLLEALAAAHDAGLVHADVKPANVIVTVPARATGAANAGGAPASSKSKGKLTRLADARVVLVDFGLARLRTPGGTTESVGGTPAYMAPEQLTAGRVDSRSDQFSAALVLVWLVTGWRRPNALTMLPAAEVLGQFGKLTSVVTRALAASPDKRFLNVRDFSAALQGAAGPPSDQSHRPMPFKKHAPLERGDRLYGRDEDLARLTEAVLYRRNVVYTAPSGTGKTSIIAAGLLPRLEELGIFAVYHRARPGNAAALTAAIDPSAPSLAAAIDAFHHHRGGKLVIVVDQLEAGISDPGFVESLFASDRWPADADVSVVLSVREDHLARVVAISQASQANVRIERLPPLSIEGAREAIEQPIAAAHLTITPDLLTALIGDLAHAAAAIAPEMGWRATPAVYPPHLQLVCSVLCESLAGTTLELAHYRRLGGFDAIVGEHLDRVIESELAGREQVARDVFVALVTSGNERALRSERELLAITGAKHASEDIALVLEVLRTRGLLLRIRGDVEPAWELTHDSLVPRVLAWIDKKDLARRRALEVVRFHLRRSTPDTPSLLGRKELRELARYTNAVTELDAEWTLRDDKDAIGWSPSRLVAHSRRSWRRRAGTVIGIVAIALTVGIFGIVRWQIGEAHAREEERLRDLDLGRFVLEIAIADPQSADLHRVQWTLHRAGEDGAVGAQLGEPWLVAEPPHVDDRFVAQQVEAHAGPAYLVIHRGDCPPSIVPLRRLPGYATRLANQRIRVTVPSCAMSFSAMIEVPAGKFVFGGIGEPATETLRKYPEPELVVDEPRFSIDRTEVTNRDFLLLADQSDVTGVARPSYPTAPNVADLSAPELPVAGIDWYQALAYCRFHGKQLPTSRQWSKAFRGGLLVNGAPNSAPRRNLAWGVDLASAGELLATASAPPGSHRIDVSPYGVLDMTGNVSEWTATNQSPSVMTVRGGNWADAHDGTSLLDFNAIENPRATTWRYFGIGARCARTTNNEPFDR